MKVKTLLIEEIFKRKKCVVKLCRRPVCSGKVRIVRNTTGRRGRNQVLRLTVCQSGLSTVQECHTSQQLSWVL